MTVHPPADRRLRYVLLARALRSVIYLELVIRRRSVPALCHRSGITFTGFSVEAQESSGLSWDVAHRWWAVEAVLSRWPWATTRPCLRRSLMLGQMLSHLSPSLGLEMRSVEPFSAHAFLVVRGVRLDMGETGPVAFAAVPR